VRRADNFTIFMCQLSQNVGASTSCKPQGLTRSVWGLLYLYIHVWYLTSSIKALGLKIWLQNFSKFKAGVSIQRPTVCVFTARGPTYVLHTYVRACVYTHTNTHILSKLGNGVYSLLWFFILVARETTHSNSCGLLPNMINTPASKCSGYYQCRFLS
jgi:hypothetical protein